MRLQHIQNLTLYQPEDITPLELPYFDVGISAGFPSPSDSTEQRLSLNKELVKNKKTTFFAKVNGQSMIGAGLNDNDLLIIDKSIEPTDNKIAVCFIDGEFTVKRLKLKGKHLWLIPENPNYNAIKITEDNHFMIWGIVTNVIKKL